MLVNSNRSDLIFDKNESDSIPSWDNRSTQNQKECLRLFNEITARANVLYVIQASYAWDGVKYPRKQFPLVFTSKADAWDFLHLSPDINTFFGKCKSYTVETVRFNKIKITKPGFRKPLK